MNQIEAKRAQVSGVLEEIDRQRGLLAGHVMTPQPSCVRAEATVLEAVREALAAGREPPAPGTVC